MGEVTPDSVAAAAGFEPYVQKAVEWLKSHQNLDGGWGECCESYEDMCLKGIGMSTPSQTAWAVMVDTAFSPLRVRSPYRRLCAVDKGT